MDRGSRYKKVDESLKKTFVDNNDNVEVAFLQKALKEEEIDIQFGFARFSNSDSGNSDVRVNRLGSNAKERIGFLVNIQPSLIVVDNGIPESHLDMYFVEQNGSTFKASIAHRPYFYVSLVQQQQQLDINHQAGHGVSSLFGELETHLKRKYEKYIFMMEVVAKEDLDLKNHLSGLKKNYLKLSFLTVQSLLYVRQELLPIVRRNRQSSSAVEFDDVHNRVCFQ